MADEVALTKLPLDDPQRAQSLDDLADGYYEADLDGRLTAANASLCRLLACADAAQVVGDLPSRFLDPETWERVCAAGERILAGEQDNALVECTVTRADGTPGLLEISVALLHNADSEPIGYCGIVRDLAVRTTAAESARLIASLQSRLIETQSLYVAMSELEQLKTHMLRVLAHDLRSPLSIITSYLELLNDDLAPHYNEMDGMYVNAIRQAVVRITQLTSDVLSLERLHETGDVALTPVSLGGVLEHVVAQFSDEIRQRGQALSVSIEQLAVDGDTTELREAITNLIGNAVKYTGSGGTITVLLRREDDSALLEIADTGYGIPADQQDGLFQPFHRVKTRETYAIDGTGLGLYLVKRIVERHGGNVYFHSEYGKGSDFGFRLPLVKDANV